MIPAILRIGLVLGSSAFLGWIVILTSRRIFSVRLSLIWLFFALAMLVLAIFPGIADAVAGLLHVREPSNLVFLMVTAFLVMLAVQTTMTLTRHKKNEIRLAQTVAILQSELDQLRQSLSDTDNA